MRKQYIKEKDYGFLWMKKLEWWSVLETDASAKHHSKESFSYKTKWREHFLKKTRSGSVSRYVQCDTHVPEHLREQSATFSAIFKRIKTCRQDIGPSLK